MKLSTISQTVSGVSISHFQKKISLLLGLFFLTLLAFATNAPAMLPPVRSVTITSQTSGSTTNYKFSVFDAQRNQTVEGNTGFVQNGTFTVLPTVTDGLVRWVVVLTSSPLVHRVYYSVYDPKLGSWRTGSQDISGLNSSGHRSKNGLYIFIHQPTSIDGYVNLVTYDPALSSWQSASYGFSTAINNSFGSLEIGDATAAWTTSYQGGQTFTRVHTVAYNALSHVWGKDYIEHGNLAIAIALNPITSGTVNYVYNGTNLSRGYNYSTNAWFNGTTIPMAYFHPSQDTGHVPLKVYFWNLSIGSSSQSWSFGDGGTSADPTPFYTYNSALNSPYTATQTVNGPGGSANRSVTITPTTPHSIGGNVANSNGFKIANATVTSSGTISRVTQTNANGDFSFVNLTGGGNYTVTVSKASYAFTPANRVFNNLSGAQTGSFTGKLSDKPSDFDGDGKTDISIFRPSTGDWWISNSSNSSVSTGNLGTSTDIVTPGDFDGDGKTDVAVFRPSTGVWYVLQSSTATFAITQYGTSGDIPVARDFDGDDKYDLAVFRPSNANWYIFQSSNSQGVQGPFGLSGDKPVPGDYDGDNKADVAVFRPSNWTWYVLKSSDSNYLIEQFGDVNDNPVQGDYDGDGKTDFATYRPGDTTWRVKQSSNGSAVSQSWGASGDLLIPGDYDGDGKYDYGVFRPSDPVTNWYVLLSSNQGWLTALFGNGTDYPTARAYIPQ